MKESNVLKGVRVKVKDSCKLRCHVGLYGTIMKSGVTDCGQVLVKLDGFYGDYGGNVKLQLSSLKHSDEKPNVGDRIIIRKGGECEPFYYIGASGVVVGVDCVSIHVRFDSGDYRGICGTVWFVPEDKKFSIIPKGGNV
jgi:hypothetical protein